MPITEEIAKEEKSEIKIGNIVFCVIIISSVIGLSYVLIRKYKKERR